MSAVNLKDKIIVVTGAAGFIGAALCERLLAEQEAAAIIGIDNLSGYYDVSLKKHRLSKLQEDATFTFVKGNIADRDFLTSIFENYRPHLVVNLAAQAGVRNSESDPDAYIESNLVGFFRILEGCRNYPVEHLVYASSSSVYGSNQKVPFAVDDRTDTPISLYAATKKSDELMAYAYSSLYQIPCTGLRLFTVYGPAGRPDMAYYSFTNKLRAGENIQLFNYGNCERDFTFIDDIIEGISRVIRRAPGKSGTEDGQWCAPHRLYNIGSGNPKNLLGFVEVLGQELIRANVLPENFDIAAHVDLVPMQPGDLRITCADVTDLVHDFGYRPTTTLRTGLRRFAEWYREYYGNGEFSK